MKYDFSHKESPAFFTKRKSITDSVHYVEGPVYQPYVKDKQGDYMTEEDIRHAEITFVKNGSRIDLFNHDRDYNQDHIKTKTSYILKSEQHGCTPGTWFVGAYIFTDNPKGRVVWDMVENGVITGWSMAGFARPRGKK